MSGSDREAGTNEDRIEAIASQIANWMDGVNWEDPEAAAAAQEKLFEGGVDAFIDPSLSASANYEIFKDEFSLRTGEDAIKEQRDAEEQMVDSARRAVRRQLEEYGIDTVAAVLADSEPPSGISQEQFEEARQDVQSVLDEFPPDIYDEEIQNRVGQVFDELGGDFTVVSESLLEAIRQDEGEQADVEQVRGEVVNEISRAFGQNFDSVEDAIERLRSRLGDIERVEGTVRFLTDEDRLEVSPASGSIEATTEDVIGQRVIDSVDLSAFRNPQGLPVQDPVVARWVTEDGAVVEFNTEPGERAAARARGDVFGDDIIAEEALNRLRNALTPESGVEQLLTRFNEDTLEELARQAEDGELDQPVFSAIRDRLQEVDRNTLLDLSEDNDGLAAILESFNVVATSAVGQAINTLERSPETAGQDIDVDTIDFIVQALSTDEFPADQRQALNDALDDLSDDGKLDLIQQFLPEGGEFFDSPIVDLLQLVDTRVPPPENFGTFERGASEDAMIRDAETGEPVGGGGGVVGPVNVPEAELAVTPGRGKDASHYQQVIQELQGRREPEKIPQEEIEALQNAPEKRQQLIQQASQQLIEKGGSPPEGVGGSAGGVGMGGQQPGGAGGGQPTSGIGGMPQGGGEAGGGGFGTDEEDRLERIAAALPVTAFSVTDRPNPNTQAGQDEIKRRFPSLSTRQAYEQFEIQRLGIEPRPAPDEFWENFIGDPTRIPREAFMAAQQTRFIGVDEGGGGFNRGGYGR